MVWITYDKNNGSVLDKHSTEPTVSGDKLKVLLEWEFLPSQPLQLFKYNGSTLEKNTEENIAKYLYGGYADEDMLFCHSILLDFKNEMGPLDLNDTNFLLTTLGGALEYIRIGAPKHLKSLLENTEANHLLSEDLKEKFLNKISNYLIEYPR